jgi:hypothetical protein
MKRIMKRRARKLDPQVARLVRGTSGAAAHIAELMHGTNPGPINRSYVSRVVAGEKPPSMNFLRALDYLLSGAKRRVNAAMLRRAHPEIDS